jgi:hypothetical protein
MYLHRNSGFMYPSLYLVLQEAAAAVLLPAKLTWNIYFNPLLHNDLVLESFNKTETWHGCWRVGEVRLQPAVTVGAQQLMSMNCWAVFWGYVFICPTDIHKHDLLTYLLTYSTEQSTSWEANWFSAIPEISHILWNPNVHYRIYKCLPPVPILSHIDLVHGHNPLPEY